VASLPEARSTAANDPLLWSRVLSGPLTWGIGNLSLRVVRVRWNQHAPRADRTRPHRHPFHQLLYYSRGRGTQRLGVESRSVGPGCICFIPAGVLHSFVGSGSRPATCLAIDLELGATFSGDAEVLMRALEEGERHVFNLSSRSQRQVAACMNRIGAEIDRAAIGHSTAIQGLLLQLLALFLRAAHQAGRLAAPVSDASWAGQTGLRKVIALADVEATSTEEAPLSLARAAEEAGVSANHLNRLLRQQTGSTFRQLVIARRLERAKALLGADDGNCTEVALACGFADSNYFARLFRQKMGLTPTEFRRRARRHG
jgi:AraC-like DNA-binding protein/quercetin dioxygenase-like cupin family protein